MEENKDTQQKQPAHGKKKNWINIIGIILIVVAVILLVISSMSGKIIKTSVETVGPKVLKVGVTLDKADLSIFSGSVELKGLSVDNPEGYQNPKLMDVGRIYAKADLPSMMSDKVIIDKITLENLAVTLEQKGITNNLNEIMKNLPKKEPSPAEEEKPAKALQITRLEMKDVEVNVKLLPTAGTADTITLKLAPIEMDNLGTDDKMTLATLTGKIITALAVGIAQQGAGQLPKEMISNMSSVIKEQGGMFLEKGMDIGKKSLETGTDVGKDVGEKVMEGAGDAVEGIKNIFGGDK